MQCPNCGANNLGQNRFCGSCGTPLELPADRTAAPATAPANKNTVYIGNLAIPALVALPVLACIALFCMGVTIVASSLSSRQGNDVPTARSTNVARVTEIVKATATRVPTFTPTPQVTLSPTDTLKAIAESAGNTYATDVKTAVISGTVALIEYKPTANWMYNEESIIHYETLAFRDVTPKIFSAFPAVALVDVRMYADLQNAYGNKSNDVVMRLVITRATADKVTWANYQSKNLELILTGKGDQFFVHSALRPAWTKYKTQ